MSRPRNFLPLAGFLVCLLAFVSYFLIFYLYPVTRDVPWVSWLIFAVGIALVTAGIVRAFRQRETYRGRVWGPILGVLSLAIVGMFLFVTTVESRRLPAAAGAPQVGQKAPDFTLPDAQGRPVRLSELMAPASGSPGSWVLLIFYRGYW